MNASILTLCLAATCALGPNVCAAPKQTPTTQLTILIYDYSGASDSTIHEAETVSSLMLSRANITTGWFYCAGHPQNARLLLCDGDLTPGTILIRILPAHVGRHNKLGDPLGSAVVDVGYASLYANEIRKHAQQHGLTPETLMGYAMAHEIGHLLLGEKHAKSGIMQAVWGKKEYSQMAQRWLAFSAKERMSLNEMLLDTRGMTSN